MAQQILKYCKNCNKTTFFEWEVDNEIQDEPIFWLICTECCYETDIDKLELEDFKYD